MLSFHLLWFQSHFDNNIQDYFVPWGFLLQLISEIKKCQNILRQNKNGKDISSTLAKSPTKNLNSIEYLAEGGFGSIWKAEWIDMPEEVFEFYKSNQVALKKLKNSQEISSEFLKEVNIKYINI